MLLRKPRTYSEIYNDLYGDVVRLFRLLRDTEKSEQLVRAIELTPFSREEFDACRFGDSDDLENARRLIVRSHQGFGSDSAIGQITGFRANSSRSGTTPAHDWRNLPSHIRSVAERFRGVVIEQRPAIAVMSAHDSPDTLHYCDPPYMWSTRAQGNPHCKKHLYAFEMSDTDHEELLTFLATLQGFVVLSGYRTALYDSLLSQWKRVDKASHADGARERTESLWMNPACEAALQNSFDFSVVAS